METKEKLLTLIDNCLEKSEFYDKYTDPSRQLKVNQGTNINMLGTKQVDKYNIYFGQYEAATQPFNMHYEQYNTIFDLNKKQYQGLYTFPNSGLIINFCDLPPISVDARCSEEVIESRYIDINDVESVKVKNFWGKTLKVEDKPTGYTVKFLLKITKRTPKFEIVSGTIREEITEQEFNALIEKYKANKEVFEKKIDEQIIDDRLRYYGK